MKKYLFCITFLTSTIFSSAQNLANEKTIAVPIKGVNIEGTLLSGSAKEKLVIIIAGSGPTDRNGNSGQLVQCDTYKLLADTLAQQHISSFRYDKRGIAKSATPGFKEQDLVFDDYVDDAVAIYNYMKDTLGFKKIYFAGHSEGSLIGMLASKKTQPQGYISIAGAGRPIDKIIVEQVGKQFPPLGRQVDSLFGVLKTTQKIDSVPPYLLSIFRSSVQPYMLSWMKYDPAVEISTLPVPILILQGTCDIQVKQADAENLYNGNKKARFVLVEGMTHVLKNAAENCADNNMATYHNFALPLNEKLVKELLAFVKAN